MPISLYKMGRITDFGYTTILIHKLYLKKKLCLKENGEEF